MINQRPYMYKFVLVMTVLLSTIMHRGKFNKELSGIHTWRQTQTQWNIRNFYRHDANILNPRVANFNGGKDNIYRYEFPVMQWCIAQLQRAFGEGIIVTRLSIFFIGLLSLWGFFLMLSALGLSPIVASLSTFAFNFSPVFFYYTINPIPDNLALASIIWFLFFFIRFVKTKQNSSLILSAFCVSIAILAKLPFIVFGLSMALYFIYLFLDFKKNNLHIFKIFVFYSLALIPPILWYVWVIPGWSGNGIVKGILDDSVPLNESYNILKYHFEYLFPYVILNRACWIFLIVGIYYLIKNYSKNLVLGSSLLACLFGVLLYYIFELNMIEYVHDYYLFPFLPILYLPIAYGIKWFYEKNQRTKLALVLLLMAMPFLSYNKNKNSWDDFKSGANHNLYIYQNELKHIIPNDEKVIMMNDHSNYIFSYLIDKQGYIFKNDHLPTPWIIDMVKNNEVQYFYSDSRLVDEREDVQKLIDTMLLEKGDIRVFKMKHISK